jgi:hypothetical protein
MPAAQHLIRVKARHGGRLGIGLWAAACLVGLAGCVAPHSAGSPAADLAARLEGLRPTVAPAEAALAARTAYFYSAELAREYRVVRPAILHNVLVNLGLRKRGLCFQWADDLSAKLQSLQLHTLQLHRGVARLETRREHSSVVLTAPGQPFDEGIVLDAWRHSGRLYWDPVKGDKYPWIEVEVVAESAAPAHTSLKSGH